MVFKRALRFLFMILMMGAVLSPSDSWAMDKPTANPPPKQGMRRARASEPPTIEQRQQIETPASSFAYCPYDLLHFIYKDRESFLPVDWVKAGAVSKYWYQALNRVELWKFAGRWKFSNPHIENGQKALEILNNLFEKAPPHLKSEFQFDWPLTVLPFQDFNTNPTAESFKDFYIYGYLKDRGDEASSIYLYKANEQRHPTAGWKIFKKNRSVTNSQHNIQCLYAALGGEPKAQTKAFEIILNSLGWNKILEQDSFDINIYQENFQKVVKKTIPVNKNFPFLFNECVKLAEIWPGGREQVLRCAMPPTKPHNPLPHQFIFQLWAIGEGKPTELFFGQHNGAVPIHVTWKEAFLVLGKHFLQIKNLFAAPEMTNPINNYKNAFSCFIQACPVGAEDSAHLLANHIDVASNPIILLRNIQKHLPATSGTVLAKYALIMINELPKDAPDLDPKVQEFLHFAKNSYKQLLIKDYSPSLISGQDIREQKDLNYRKVTKASHFIDILGGRLNQRGEEFFGVSTLFLDWVRTTPQYAYTPWVHKTIHAYLTKKWGNSLCSDGKFAKDAEMKNWNIKDTQYALEYFHFRNARLFHRFVLRNFHQSLMNISLKAKEEKTFTRCFKQFSRTFYNDELNKTNYNILRFKLNKFLKIYPINRDLPLFFGKLLHGKEAWRSNAIEYFKIAAKNGSTEAQDFLLALTGEQKDLTTVSTKIDGEHPEEPPTKKRKYSEKKSLPRKMNLDEITD
jgi:hypothetical protein